MKAYSSQDPGSRGTPFHSEEMILDYKVSSKSVQILEQTKVDGHRYCNMTAVWL